MQVLDMVDAGTQLCRWTILAAAATLPGCDLFGPDHPDGSGNEALLVWRTDLGGWIMPPAVDEDHVYYEHSEWPSPDTELLAVSRDDGAPAWSAPVTGAENAMVVGNVVGVVWGNLRVFDRLSGEALWRYPDVSGLSSNLATDGQIFFVGGHSPATVYALDAVSGSVVWESRLSGHESWIVSGVSVVDDYVAIAAFNPQLAPVGGLLGVLDAGHGAVRWTLRTGAMDDPPVQFEDLVIARTWDHTVMAVDRDSGLERWSVEQAHGEHPVMSNGLVLCGERVIAPGGDMSLTARGPRTGDQDWKTDDLRLGSISSVTCSHETVFAAGTGQVRALDPRTGRTLLSLPDAVVTDSVWAATRDADRIYLSGSGGLYALTVPGDWR